MQSDENDSISNESLNAEQDDDKNTISAHTSSSSINDSSIHINETKRATGYEAKKPNWWKRMAGRRGTTGQRKAISRMTAKGYVIPTKLGKYQHEVNVAQIFEKPPNGKAITSETIMVPIIVEKNGVRRSNVECIPKDKHVALEIGFGLGDNILTNATKFPHQYYIGAEIHQPGVGIALMRMEKAIEAETFWLEQTWVDENDLTQIQERDNNPSMKPYDNLRIYPGDGIKLLGCLPENSLDSIYLTFPDPWPKEEHHCWRVIQEETVFEIGRVLKPGGCFYLATDAIVFDEWTQGIFQNVLEKNRLQFGNERWLRVDPCPDRSLWLPAMSKYEEKGIEEGRHTVCRCWKYTGEEI